MSDFIEIRGKRELVMSRWKRLVYHLGRRYKIVRTLYCRLSGHTYLWGIVNYVSDFGTLKPFEYSEDEFEKIIERIFKSGGGC